MSPARTPSTVAEILSVGLVGTHDVLAGRHLLNRPVGSVSAIPDGDDTSQGLGPDTLVIVDAGRGDATAALAERVLRAATDGVAGIMMGRPIGGFDFGVDAGLVVLADQMDIPVVVVDALDAGAAAAAIDGYVRAGRTAERGQVELDAVDRVLRRLRQVPEDADGLVAAVSEVIGHPVAVVDMRAGVVAGDEATVAASAGTTLSGRLSADAPSALTTLFGEDHVLVCHPAVVARGLPINLWIVARLPRPGPTGVKSVARILAMAALAYTGWIAAHSLAGERQSRYRALVLADVLDTAESPSRRAVERATALGWRLSGWHTAVHISLEGEPATQGRPTAVLSELERILADSGTPVSVVQRREGWAFWVTTDGEPDTDWGARLGRRLRRALTLFADDYPGSAPAAGVGSPHEHAAGLGRSLREAQHACLLARTRGAGAVQDYGSMSVDRILVGWYGSEPLQRVTGSLLAPLRDADPSGDLVRTLATYLDVESSATAAANVLGLHRNTVLQRLDRIRALLPLDLSRPSDRLVAHLAARSFQADETGQPWD
jgi:PucR family transcriptional regulator, purine catabolism regulatory protein